MSQTTLSHGEFFVLGQLRNSESYVYKIFKTASTTWSYGQSEKAITCVLETLQSKGLVEYTGLEGSRQGPARRIWAITNEGKQTFREEYRKRMNDLVSICLQ